MTFAEKANLAGKYMTIFDNHQFITVCLIAIIVILGIIGIIFVAHSDFTISIIGILMCVSAVGLSIIGEAEQGQGNQFSMQCRAAVDFSLHRDYYQLPKYKHEAAVKYRQSLHLKGAKAYCVSHQYCHDHHKVEAMKHYLRIHNPQAPWINIKF